MNLAPNQDLSADELAAIDKAAEYYHHADRPVPESDKAWILAVFTKHDFFGARRPAPGLRWGSAMGPIARLVKSWQDS